MPLLTRWRFSSPSPSSLSHHVFNLLSDDAPTPTEAQIRRFRTDLIDWYQSVKREMPWRNTDDPYRIWVSEIMLQQTRVDQAQPYFERFIDALPTVHALASAERDEVLRLWEGLGYYSRARYLHNAAQQIVDEFDGQVPDTYDAIRQLPGVGPYTAAAVLSIAYDKPHAVLDGNVIRALSRVFAVEDNVKSAPVKRRLQAAADALIDPDQPGTFNQAMMELGALLCTPRSPACDDCPVQPACQAASDGNPEEYPVTPDKKPIPHYDIAVGLVFDDEGRLLIQRRPDEGMLGGLWEFPGGKHEDGEELVDTCRRELHEELGITVDVEDHFYTLSHAYSHFKITMHAFRCRVASGTPSPELDQPLRWVAVDALDDYAFPRANRRLIEELERRQTEPSLFD